MAEIKKSKLNLDWYRYVRWLLYFRKGLCFDCCGIIFNFVNESYLKDHKNKNINLKIMDLQFKLGWFHDRFYKDYRIYPEYCPIYHTCVWRFQNVRSFIIGRRFISRYYMISTMKRSCPWDWYYNNPLDELEILQKRYDHYIKNYNFCGSDFRDNDDNTARRKREKKILSIKMYSHKHEPTEKWIEDIIYHRYR